MRGIGAGASLSHPTLAYALDRYSPLRVSTLMISPVLTNRGACTTSPVTSVTGLLAPWAVSPLCPGGASVTSRSTVIGISIAIGLSS